MRNTLKNRKFAILITIFVAVLATVFCVYTTANRYTRRIEAVFYAEGYARQGIDPYLKISSNAALGFATCMSGYPELTDKAEKLISAQQELAVADSISEKSSAYAKMKDLFAELMDSAINVNLSSQHEEAMADYNKTFRGASIAISSSQYNDKVMEYMDGRSFLIQMASLFLPIKEPAYF